MQSSAEDNHGIEKVTTPWKHFLEVAAQSVSAPGEDFYCSATIGVKDDLGQNARPCGKKDDSSRSTDNDTAKQLEPHRADEPHTAVRPSHIVHKSYIVTIPTTTRLD